MNEECEIGIIGLGAMGRNLLLNMRDHGCRVIGLDKDSEKVRAVEKEKNISGGVEATGNLGVFLDRLRKPRAILLLVPAGAAVDEVLGELSPLLKPGDLVIDAGNSHFKDTDRREKKLAANGLFFFGMGVSGGEAGARLGPSLMPGGSEIAYGRVRSILEAIAAQVDGAPCVEYLGPGSSGHYVKMVHNGIEYGIMQLIAETFYLMKTALNLSDGECHEIYRRWNDSELNSYLLEITAKILLKVDEKTGRPLVDMILDVAKQKGTGKWASQDAMDLQVPVPTIDSAVAMRDLSAFEADRKTARAALTGPHESISLSQAFLEQLRNAFYAASLLTFSQGMSLLHRASEEYGYRLNLESVARIWRGGCIIRAAALEPIMLAFHRSPQLANLLLDPQVGGEINRRQTDLRSIVRASAGLGAPIPALMASLGYYDAYRSAWLPANLIQAQRDYFGAHTYQRVDEAGIFHSHWEAP